MSHNATIDVLFVLRSKGTLTTNYENVKFYHVNVDEYKCININF